MNDEQRQKLKEILTELDKLLNSKTLTEKQETYCYEARQNIFYLIGICY